MNLYRVTYTIFLEVEAEDEAKAVDAAAEVNLDDFILFDVEAEEIVDK